MISISDDSKKIQPKPALVDDAIQAASVLHVIVFGGSSFSGVDLRFSFRAFWGASCAASHSRAALMALISASSGVEILFSKSSRFLSTQMIQQIQGKMLIEIPIGGRFLQCSEARRFAERESQLEESKGVSHGPKLHKSRANRH